MTDTNQPTTLLDKVIAGVNGLVRLGDATASDLRHHASLLRQEARVTSEGAALAMSRAEQMHGAAERRKSHFEEVLARIAPPIIWTPAQQAEHDRKLAEVRRKLG